MNKKDRNKICRELKEKIDQLNQELEKLQNECAHPEFFLKFGDENRVYKYCKVCNKQIGIPNERELRDNGYLPKRDSENVERKQG